LIDRDVRCFEETADEIRFVLQRSLQARAGGVVELYRDRDAIAGATEGPRAVHFALDENHWQ
jgi:hypothetical protein